MSNGHVLKPIPRSLQHSTFSIQHCAGADGQGHVMLFSFNPMYRGGTVGSYAFVLNTILHFDSLNPGR
jgi:hypothetical protein